MEKNNVVKINRDLNVVGYGKICCGTFLKLYEVFENKHGKFVHARTKDGHLLLLHQKDCTIMAV